jgi:hypothetical protein
MGLAQLLPTGAALAVPFLVARWGTGHALAAGLLGVGMFLLPLAAGLMAGYLRWASTRPAALEHAPLLPEEVAS